MHKISPRIGRLASCSIVALMAATGALANAGAAAAQSQSAAPNTGGEGVEVGAVIVTAERSKAAATAPTKASVDETQPESIISRKYIEQATPEASGWVTTASIAPSVSGIESNGGGVGETTKLTMRGFQDGQFNLTYDGIAFGDTNGPTHHEASYWPTSTIGAVVIDRGPGAAGDLGPANFGGAIHFFSPEVQDTFGGSQKVTAGSFGTYEAVTQLNSGILPQTGAKLLLSFDERWSNGELSNSGGTAQNQLAKLIMPFGPNWNFTLFSSHNYTRFYQNDGFGPGATYAQVLAHGKNYALSDVPGTENYKGYNYQAKQTDFEYADLKGNLAPSITVEDQLYTYFYTNKTQSTNSTQDLTGNANSLISASGAALLPGEHTTDLGGYDKLNQYRVWGDVVRFNKDWSFGTLKVGGLYEWSTTDRHNLLEDITDGFQPDDKFTPAKYPLLTANTNAKLQENSDWQDYQLFADFYWRPINGLTITPGFKFVSEHLDVRAADENTAGGSKNQPLYDSANDSSPLYFLTANYKITPNWAVYGQFATSFLFPDITSLYFAGAGAGLESIKPEQTKTYQAGSVYSRGNFTADADVYRVDATNLLQTCGSGANTSDCNVGSARYTGVEGEAAYAFNFGLTLFANGSSNVAKQLANAGVGIIPANPAQTLANAPRWTYAYGAVYTHGPWQGTVTYKNSGAYAAYSSASGGTPITRYQLPGFDTIDASAAYDFGKFKVKLQAFNLADKRAITSFVAPANTNKLYDPSATDTGTYLFQAGRELELTLQAKF